MEDGPMAPSVVGGMVWVAGEFPSCMVVGVMWVVSALHPLCGRGDNVCGGATAPMCYH